MKRSTATLAVALLAPILLSFPAYGGDVQRIIPTSIPLQTVSPFLITGFIQKATVDSAGDPFSGGTVTVNGILVTIPRNTLFQMPATELTWGELFSLAPAPYAGTGQTGLALGDSPAPLASYEITAIGNRIVRSPRMTSNCRAGLHVAAVGEHVTGLHQ